MASGDFARSSPIRRGRTRASVSAGRDPAQAGSLNRDGAKPLWMQLRDDVAARIDAYEFDAHLPGELALAESYQVSRQTVRLALRSLRESGVISAGRGRTPKVTHTINQPMGTLYSLFTAVEAAGMVQRSIVVDLRETTSPEHADHLGLRARTKLIRLERLRLADEEPLAIDEVWLPATIARPLLKVDFTHTALYIQMYRVFGAAPTGGREEIQAVTLDQAAAAALRLRAGTAAFSLIRIGCHLGRPVEWRRTLIRGDRFRLQSSFSPGIGYQLQLDPASDAAHVSTAEPLAGRAEGRFRRHHQ